MASYMNNARQKLGAWFDKADRWQKDLFIHVWNGSLTEDELLERTVKLIGQEYLSENHRLAPNTAFPDDVSFASSSEHSVMLASISDVQGVGALAPRIPLTFGKDLTVVYGENGCGKSSYVRILKALANPANADAVFGNVFRENKVSAEATITFSVDGESQSIVWNKSSKRNYPIQIYDTIEADRFANKENEVIYEPAVLAAVTQMAKVYDRASKHFAELGKTAAQNRLPLPDGLELHPIVSGFDQLSTLQKVNAFAKEHLWTEDLAEELAAVTTGLQERDPEKAAAARIAQRDIVRNHGYAILKLLPWVSDDACSDYLEKRSRQISTKKAADLLVRASTDQSLLNGFGTDLWKAMWARAVDFVRAEEAEAALPVTGSGRCALCQQELDADAASRMEAFREFSQTSAITEADAAYRDFKAAVKSLQDNVENKIQLSEIQTVLQSGGIPDQIQDVILPIYETILARCIWLLSYSDDTDTAIPYLQGREEITAIFKALVDNLNLEIKALQEAAANRGKLVARMQELQAIQWVHADLALKKQLIRLKDIVAKCKTNALTTLKKELSKILITDAYIARFQNEMDLLDTRKQIKVELVAKSPRKGRSYHQVSLKGARTIGSHKNNEVLSEGEFRVVSLAAFLADLSSWHRNLPFIFDDPITSLDHRYERSVAQRLVQLSTERQVIVFTHRLAFAQLLESAWAEFHEGSVPAGNQERACITHIELRNSPLGQPSKPTYVGKMKLSSAITNLLNEDVAQARRLQNEGEYELADAKILSICTTFRNIVEYGVEHDLLSGIVSRFDRNVSTLKLPCLKAITEADIALFERMMTKYSYYDHSHSVEIPISLPELETLEADLREMKAWAEAFKKRIQKIR